MASKKSTIQLTPKEAAQLREVGAYYGGKGTTGSADSRERQSNKRKTDTMKALYGSSPDNKRKPRPAAKKAAGPSAKRVGTDKRVAKTAVKPAAKKSGVVQGIRQYGPTSKNKNGFLR